MVKNNYSRLVNACIIMSAKRGRCEKMNAPTILYVTKENYSLVRFLYFCTIRKYQTKTVCYGSCIIVPFTRNGITLTSLRSLTLTNIYIFLVTLYITPTHIQLVLLSISSLQLYVLYYIFCYILFGFRVYTWI